MLNFFLSVSDNRKGFEHKLIFLDELLTLHAYQLVSLTQCLHTVFWGVPGKYNKAVPEVPSGGSLEHSAPAAVCRIRSAAWLSHVGPHHCSSHCQGTQQHLSKCTQNTVLSSTACCGQAGNAGVGGYLLMLWLFPGQWSFLMSGYVSLHDYLVVCVPRAEWGARSGAWSRLRAAISVTALLLGGWDVPCQLVDLPPCAGLQDTPALSLLRTWMLCLFRVVKVVVPHCPPRDFKMVEMAKMH